MFYMNQEYFSWPFWILSGTLKKNIFYVLISDQTIIKDSGNKPMLSRSSTLSPHVTLYALHMNQCKITPTFPTIFDKLMHLISTIARDTLATNGIKAKYERKRAIDHWVSKSHRKHKRLSWNVSNKSGKLLIQRGRKKEEPDELSSLVSVTNNGRPASLFIDGVD